MPERIHIANALIVNEGKICKGDILTENLIISAVSFDKPIETPTGAKYINADGLYLFPGVIDDQVHFREPGLTHKADISHESRAAVAGGVTSYMEMPNTKPPATTLELLEQKYNIAAGNSRANFSFYMGVTNDNAEEVLKTPLDSVCGIKIFLGSSTGNLLVDNDSTLEKIFAQTRHIVAVHCEDDLIISENLRKHNELYGDNIPASMHHKIRDEKACYSSTAKAVQLAKKHNTRLHVLHLSTAEELAFFEQSLSPEQKRITAEVCVHHLWFTSDDYEQRGNFIKWNPSIKDARHRQALRDAILKGRIDVVATDHAPHLEEEKSLPYTKAPSGGPIVQFSLQIMLELVHEGVLTMEDVARLMCHNPAQLFSIHRRGFIREGYFADLVLVDINKTYTVERETIFSKCKWSPLEGTTFHSVIDTTIVNGIIAWSNGRLNDSVRGMRLMFDRQNL